MFCLCSSSDSAFFALSLNNYNIYYLDKNYLFNNFIYRPKTINLLKNDNYLSRAAANGISESLQQKLNIEQSAHSMVPAGCLVVVVGYVCSYSLELLSPTLWTGDWAREWEQAAPAASCQAGGGQDQSCGQQRHNHKIATTTTTRYCLQHSQHRNTPHHD